MGAVQPHVIVSTIVLLILTACAGTGGGTLSTRDEAVIVYGGFGLVDKRAQPVLETLLFDPPAGMQPLGVDARSLAVGRSFDRFSKSPVIGDANAFQAALGATVPDGDLPDQIDATDILVLSLFGTVELGFDVDRGSGVQDGIAFASVSAVISRAGSGEILAVSDATGREVFAADQAGGVAAAYRQRFFASLYARTAQDALDGIDGAPVLENAGARAMVTDVRVADAATARRYEIAAHGRSAGACTLVEQCTSGARANGTISPCLQLRAAMSQLTTQALAEKDVPTLPPWGWSSAASMAAYEAFKTTELLRLPTTGGFRARDDIVRLRIPESEAPRKFVAEIGRFELVDVPDGAYLVERSYQLDLELPEFSGAACDTARPAASGERLVDPQFWSATISQSVAETEMPVALELSFLIASARQQLGLEETQDGGLFW